MYGGNRGTDTPIFKMEVGFPFYFPALLTSGTKSYGYGE
jgi:hypothetical protein